MTPGPEVPRAWLDGAEIDPSRAMWTCTSPLATHGDAIFETALVAEGVLRFPELHLSRLLRSAEEVGWRIRGLDGTLLAAVEAFREAALAYRSARVRLVLAPSSDAARGGAGAWSGNLLLAVDPWERPPESAYARGQKLAVSRHPHPGLGRFGKSVSYQWSAVARREAALRGLDDVLLLRDGAVVESATAAPLWLRGGRWYGPDPELGGLPSTTAAALAQRGVEIGTERASPSEIAQCDAVVLLSALRLVTGVAELEERVFRDPDAHALPLRRLLLAWKR